MKTFIYPPSLRVINNQHEYILHKGVLHRDELTIDKEESSTRFIEDFNRFITDRHITLSEHSDTFEDFILLNRMGYIDQKINRPENILVLVEDSIHESTFTQFSELARVEKLSTILSKDLVKTFMEEKKRHSLEEKTEYSVNFLRDFDSVYMIDSMANLNRLRAFNRLMNLANLQNTIATYDNEHIFITAIHHGETGCFECLEKNIVTRFGYPEYPIESDYESTPKSAELNIITGIIQKELENINIYERSSLLGNVQHFHLQNYEYSFNTNRVHVSCPSCAEMKNIQFKEQTLRSINILEGILQ
ncbi:hypothetical protein [Exiguobacterium sp. s6]|uniref:hypothetical protein n=1 Tax=Exiguobacterium sp. s6 TaxID=2751236 RepID=UPI001BE86A3B|nr:hypothetical protein [Exiguobacterium sp. s6]